MSSGENESFQFSQKIPRIFCIPGRDVLIAAGDFTGWRREGVAVNPR